MQHALFFIDDSPKIVESAQSHLEGPLWKVAATRFASEAMDMLRATGYDIYLIDFELQHFTPANKKDGNYLVEELRRPGSGLNYHDTSPIIYFTKLVTEDEVMEKNGGKKWEKRFEEYWMPRLDDIDEVSDVLLDILQHHHATMGWPAEKSSVGGAAKSHDESLPKPFGALELPASPVGVSDDPRSNVIKLRNQLLAIVEQTEEARKDARKLISPLIGSPSLGSSALTASHDVVDGASSVIELMNRGAISLLKLADQMTAAK